MELFNYNINRETGNNFQYLLLYQFLSTIVKVRNLKLVLWTGSRIYVLLTYLLASCSYLFLKVTKTEFSAGVMIWICYVLHTVRYTGWWYRTIIWYTNQVGSWNLNFWNKSKFKNKNPPSLLFDTVTRKNQFCLTHHEWARIWQRLP